MMNYFKTSHSIFLARVRMIKVGLINNKYLDVTGKPVKLTRITHEKCLQLTIIIGKFLRVENIL